jgi:hypothetical protein
MNRSGVLDGDANNTGTALSAARKRERATVRWRMGRAVRPSKSRGHGPDPLVDGDLDKSNWARPDDVGAATWTLPAAQPILLCGTAVNETISSSDGFLGESVRTRHLLLLFGNFKFYIESQCWCVEMIREILVSYYSSR